MSIVLCGPGNNGGDGFVAARLLAEKGVGVSVALLGSEGALRGDAAEARRLFSGPLEDAARTALDDAGLIVDALFGAGLSRPMEGDAAALLNRIKDARTQGRARRRGRSAVRDLRRHGSHSRRSCHGR